ncbi:hypothetical protein HK102_010543 [Quaeritorhiza haematococci]|nr:hypothetical protein HK102_010543 [Quaeritorhiza haematococci]
MDGLSVDEFRFHLYDSLQRKGIADNLKCQLRSKIVSELKFKTKSHLNALVEGSGGAPGKGTLMLKLVDTLVIEYLKARDYEFALSVFMPECGLTQKDQKRTLGQENGDYINGSLLVKLLTGISQISHTTFVDKELQTELELEDVLEIKLRSANKNVASKTQEQGKLTTQALEERIYRYQQELEYQMKSTMEEQLAKFKEVELAQMRVEERKRYQQEKMQLKADFERQLLEQKERATTVEEQARARFEEKERAIERQKLDMQQQLLEASNRTLIIQTQLKNETELLTKELNMERDSIQRKYEEAKRQIGDLQEFKERYQTKMQEAMAQYKIDLNREHATLLANVEIEKNRLEAERSMLIERQRVAEQMLDQVRSTQQEMKDLRNQLKAAKDDLGRAALEKSTLHSTITELQLQVDSQKSSSILEFEIQSLKKQLVEAERMAEKRQEEHQILLKSLMTPHEEMQRELNKARKAEQRWQRECESLVAKFDLELNRNEELQRKLEDEILRNKELRREVADLRLLLHQTQTALSHELAHHGVISETLKSWSPPRVRSDLLPDPINLTIGEDANRGIPGLGVYTSTARMAPPVGMANSILDERPGPRIPDPRQTSSPYMKPRHHLPNEGPSATMPPKPLPQREETDNHEFYYHYNQIGDHGPVNDADHDYPHAEPAPPPPGILHSHSVPNQQQTLGALPPNEDHKTGFVPSPNLGLSQSSAPIKNPPPPVIGANVESVAPLPQSYSRPPSNPKNGWNDRSDQNLNVKNNTVDRSQTFPPAVNNFVSAPPSQPIVATVSVDTSRTLGFDASAPEPMDTQDRTKSTPNQQIASSTPSQPTQVQNQTRLKEWVPYAAADNPAPEQAQKHETEDPPQDDWFERIQKEREMEREREKAEFERVMREKEELVRAERAHAEQRRRQREEEETRRRDMEEREEEERKRREEEMVRKEEEERRRKEEMAKKEEEKKMDVLAQDPLLAKYMALVSERRERQGKDTGVENKPKAASQNNSLSNLSGMSSDLSGLNFGAGDTADEALREENRTRIRTKFAVSPERIRPTEINMKALQAMQKYQNFEIIYYNTSHSLVIQRATSTQSPERKVICKSTKLTDENEREKLHHEYQVLQTIHAVLSEIEEELNAKSPAGAEGQHQQHPQQQYRDRLIIRDASSISDDDAPGDARGENRVSTSTQRRRKRMSISGHSMEGKPSWRIVRPIELLTHNELIVLVLEDFGGCSLRRYMNHEGDRRLDAIDGDAFTTATDGSADRGVQRLSAVSGESFRVSLDEFLSIAVQLAEALEIVHGVGVMHKDINPDNIVIRKEESGAIYTQLIDFNLSEVVSMDAPPKREVQGTLAYLSPEQTGRLDQPVDFRTDFYSLGVTFWEMLVGRPPFSCSDATEYVHSHLAIEIEPANLFNTNVPTAIAAIISKMVEKNPEHRYHSAGGLRYDLYRCYKRLRSGKQMQGLPAHARLSDEEVAKIFADVDFELGQRDYPHHLKIPNKMYGREPEFEELIKVFNGTVGGQKRVVLVSGAFGEGKTTFVNQLQKHVREKHGIFICGKYDMAKQDKPYSGLLDALEQLIRYLLTEADDTFNRWKDMLRNEVGTANLSAVASVLPDLALVVDNGAPHDSQYSFWTIFSKLSYFLLVGAHRADPTHQDTSRLISLEAFVQEAPPRTVTSIDLKPLYAEDVEILVHEAMKPLAHNAPDVGELALHIYEKTMGNPFHVREFLYYAERLGLIHVDEAAGGWTWDVQGLDNHMKMADNVIDLLIRRLQSFTPDAQNLLQLAACLGNQFDVRFLASISGMTACQAANLLWVAVNEGLLIPVTDSISKTRHRFANMARISTTSESPPMQASKFTRCSMKDECIGFAKELKQAAYAMIPREMQQQTHLKVARLLTDGLPAEDIEENIYEIANHYNEALELVSDYHERLYIAKLNCDAGLKAKQASAHIVAGRYLNIGLTILVAIGNESPGFESSPAESVEAHESTSYPQVDRKSLMFNVRRILTEIRLIENNQADAERLCEELVNSAITMKEKAIARQLHFTTLNLKSQHPEIISRCKQELASLSLPIPSTEEELTRVTDEDVTRVLESLIDTLTVDELVSSTRQMTDTEVYVATCLYQASMAAGWLNLQSLLKYLCVKGSILVLERGMSQYAPVFFAGVCRIYFERERVDFDRIRRLSDFTFQTMSFSRLAVRVVAGMHLLHNGYWLIMNNKDVDEMLRNHFEWTREAESLLSAAIAVIGLFENHIFHGISAKIFREVETKYKSTMQRCIGPVLQCYKAWSALFDAFSSGQLVSQPMNPQAARSISEFEYGIGYLTLLFAALYETPGRVDLMSRIFASGEKNKANRYKLLDMSLFAALIWADEYPKLSAEEKPKAQQNIESAINTLEKLIENESNEHHCKLLFAKAEKARITGDFAKAVVLYDAAIDAAHQNGFLLYEAWGYERFGRFWIENNSPRLGKACMIPAYHAYLAWGAEGKTKILMARYPDLLSDLLMSEYQLPNGKQSTVGSRRSGSSAANTAAANLDVTTFLKVGQAITSESSLEDLLAKVLKYVMANAGARKGVLLLQEGGKLFVQGQAEISDGTTVVNGVLQGIPIEKAGGNALNMIPVSAVMYVFRLKDTLVLPDARTHATYGNDPYVKQNRPRSILCTPLVHQNSVTGVLYLENAVQHAAFTAERVDMIRSLMASASVSIENLRLSKKNTELANALELSKTNKSSTSGRPRYNIDAPIQKTIDLLTQIKKRLGPDDAGAKQLDLIMTTLTSVDLFASSIDEINDEQGRGIDQDTKNWIENSLLQKSSKKPTFNRQESRDQMFSPSSASNASPDMSGLEEADGGHGTLGAGGSSLAITRTTPTPAAKARYSVSRQSLVNINKNISAVDADEIASLLEGANSQNFDVFKFVEATHGRPLYYLGYYYLQKYGLIEHFNASDETVRNYFETVESQYHNLPYHNSIHAADVLQTVNLLLLSDPEMAENFTKLEIFAACVGSAVHDVDHPGLNNNFLVQTAHPLAVMYNDVSVLEFHHASKAFDIAQRPECNIFSGMPNDQFRDARKLIISMVVATDMAQHFQYINKLKGKIAASSLRLEDPSDRALVLEIAIKCADLNNPAKTTEASIKWAYRVMEEFFGQGDRERKMGIPVSKFMDRHDTNIPKW